MGFGKLVRLVGAVMVASSLAGGASGAAERVLPESDVQMRLSFAPLAKEAMPAVVNIYTRKIVRTRATSPLLNDPFFRQFFGDQLGLGAPQERIQRSLGSGVIVGAEGLVVTNYHVVADSDEITVVLADRREYEARLLGSDERTDLAILKVTAGEDLPVLDLGDSDTLEVGDLVLAIGNPFGVGQTVTSGIVSAIARSNVGIGDFQSFIQTDAAINPGNSGGALIDMTGRLIGINTAIYSKNGGSNGIGFAIPTSMVRAVINSISAGGTVVRPWLGASGQEVTADLASQLSLSRPGGVMIDRVYPKGPADVAGLEVGDVVFAVNGKAVNDVGALRFRLATLPIGSKALLSVQRRGTEQRVALELVAAPDNPPRSLTEIKGRNPFSGSVIGNLNPAFAEEMGMNTIDRGVVIVRMRRGSVAHRLGFHPEDIILSINGRKVSGVDEFMKAVNRPAAKWSIDVRRSGEVISLVVGG